MKEYKYFIIFFVSIDSNASKRDPEVLFLNARCKSKCLAVFEHFPVRPTRLQLWWNHGLERSVFWHVVIFISVSKTLNVRFRVNLFFYSFVNNVIDMLIQNCPLKGNVDVFIVVHVFSHFYSQNCYASYVTKVFTSLVFSYFICICHLRVHSWIFVKNNCVFV